MDVSISQDPFAPDAVPVTHMLAGAERDEPKSSAEPSAVDAPVDASGFATGGIVAEPPAPDAEDAFAFTTGGWPDPTPPAESAGPTETTTEEESHELPDA